MSDGQTPRAADDATWSEEHAETGGWPPPAPDQRRYGPGLPATPDTPGAYGTGEPGPPADGARPGTADFGPPGGADPGTAGYGPPEGPRPGTAGYGPPDSAPGPARYGPPDSAPGTGGYGLPEGTHPGTAGYRPAGGAHPGGPGPDTIGHGPGPGTPGAAPAGWAAGPTPAGWAAGPAPAPWAPGDSAYGRLGGPATPGPTPPRPTSAGPARPAARRPRTTGGTQVTIGLIVACVLFYLVQQADQTITYRFGMLPVAVTDGGEYYRLVTAAFLHAGLLHLATNMLTLYIVGTPLERVLGPARYLTIYLVSALGGSLLSLWLSPAFSVGVGASGAIFGLFGALVVLRRQVGAEAGGLFVLIGLNLVISFAIPNISWQAHIGGLVTGALVALAVLPTLRPRRR